MQGKATGQQGWGKGSKETGISRTANPGDKGIKGEGSEGGSPEGWLVCWSLMSLCHSNGHIETMPAREINPFTALTRSRSQLLRTQ